MRSLITILAALALVSVAYGQNCANPIFSSVKHVVTRDTKLNTETAYTVEFQVDCGKALKNLPFYAQVNDQFISSTCDETGRKYQISWSENHKTASAGEIKLRIFNEDGFFNYKKAQRNNEDLSKIKEVHNISFEHQANYRGPYLQSELVAILFFGTIFYVAQSAKSSIQA